MTAGAGAADYAETHEQPNVDAELAAAAKAWEARRQSSASLREFPAPAGINR